MRSLHLGNSFIGFIAITAFATIEASASENVAKIPELLDATLDQLRKGIDAGHFTSVDLTHAYLARLKELNDDLNIVIEVNPDALAIAKSLDKVRSDLGTHYGPLHGIPILVKDKIGTSDRMNTTAGSFALLGAKPRGTESTVIRKIRKAGAIILGKTNMSQWSGGRSLSMPQGWSARGGQGYGAYFELQNPYGSSTGSAVATSLGLALASLGTETTTSLIGPAHVANCVAIKPTVGLTSQHLVIPLSSHQDSVGPIARTVKDAAYLLSAIAGPDQHDSYTSEIPFTRVPDYAGACQMTGLHGKRIGIVLNPSEFADVADHDPSTLASFAAFNESLSVLRAAGAELVEGISLPGLSSSDLTLMQMVIILADFRADLPKYLAQLRPNPNKIRTLKDVFSFIKRSRREKPDLDDAGLLGWAVEEAPEVESPEFLGNWTTARQQAGEGGIVGALSQHSLDAIVMPSMYAAMAAEIPGTPVVILPLGEVPDNSPRVPDRAKGDISIGAQSAIWNWLCRACLE